MVLDIICVGMGMGVPIFCILFGFLVGWYIARMVTATTEEIREVLRKLLLHAAVTSAFTFVVMAAIWGRCLAMLFDPSADFANFGIPLILYDPQASFIGWLVLMIAISPFLQLLATLFGSHVTLLHWLRSDVNSRCATKVNTRYNVSDDMQSRLQAYYARAFPARENVKVRQLANITAGWESEMYSFDVEYGPAGEHQREELILRIYPGDDAYSKSAHEFHGMSQLHRAGYPVPRVLVLEREHSPFGKPFVIMERIEGQVLWPLLFGPPEGKQRELLSLFCKLFIQLHALEWRPFVHDVARYDTGDPYIFVDRELSKWRCYLARFPKSDFLPVIEWLESRRDQVPCPRPSPIHWDYHPGNVLLRDDGSAVVIDWTQLDISDSRFDLAWTLLLVSSYQGLEWRERILREYERLAGAPVEQIEYFDVAACFKRLGSVALSLSYGPEKLGMRPEAQADMRQQMGSIKRVYDLLLERTGIKVVEVERLLASLS